LSHEKGSLIGKCQVNGGVVVIDCGVEPSWGVQGVKAHEALHVAPVDKAASPPRGGLAIKGPLGVVGVEVAD